MRARSLHLLAIVSLTLVFLWVYARFASSLFFVLDDYIETEAALARPLSQAIADSFSGALNWSGYRPVAYALRAQMAHLFRLDRVAGYYVVGMLLHFASALLTYRLVWRISRQVAWAFLAAMWLLLLPSHNEAVLYMSANANLVALFFALLALDFSLSARVGTPVSDGLPARGDSQAGGFGATRWLWAILAALAWLLALLSYEVVIALPLLVWLADQAMERGALRRNWRLYAAFAAALIVMLILRAAAGPTLITRSDYALNLNPLHIARGYTILLGQMTLLHSSPWQHLPFFSWFREWMSPLNPRALASMLLVSGLAVTTVVLALRRAAGSGEARKPGAPFWLLWGLLWVLAISLPFAALAGRNPENRYTTIPAFGLAVAATALVAWLCHTLRNRTALRWSIVGLAIGLLTLYAYVDTSDVSEWERASLHTRSFYDGVLAALPVLAGDATVAQVGVPGAVGAAYTFTTAEAFDAAMRLRYGVAEGHFPSGDLAARTVLDAGTRPVLLTYDRHNHTTQAASAALLCTTVEDCRTVEVAPPPIAGETQSLLYVQLYDEARPDDGGLALLVDGAEPHLRSCWAFHDLERTTIDPSTFDSVVLDARCRDTFTSLADAGYLAKKAP